MNRRARTRPGNEPPDVDILGLRGWCAMSNDRRTLAHQIRHCPDESADQVWLPIVIEELTLLLPEGHARRFVDLLRAVRDYYRGRAGIGDGVPRRNSPRDWARLAHAMIVAPGQSLPLADVVDHRQQRARLREFLERDGGATVPVVLAENDTVRLGVTSGASPRRRPMVDAQAPAAAEGHAPTRADAPAPQTGAAAC